MIYLRSCYDAAKTAAGLFVDLTSELIYELRHRPTKEHR